MAERSYSPRYIQREEFEVFSRRVEHGFTEVSDALAALGGKIDSISGRGVPWGPVISAAGLLLSVITAVGAVAWFGIDNRIAAIDRAVERHIDLEGHPSTISQMRAMEGRVEANSRVVQNLDAVLQREMRLLGDPIKQQIEMYQRYDEERAQARLQYLDGRFLDVTRRLEILEGVAPRK